MTVRLKFVLATGFSLWSACSGDGPSTRIQHDPTAAGDADLQPPFELPCTIDELLPLSCTGKSSEWADDTPVDPAYDCTCATIKGR